MSSAKREPAGEEPRVIASGHALVARHDAAPGDHAVQFYEDDQYLCEVVARFLADGLAAGDGLVVIATAEHRTGFCAGLRLRRVDVERSIAGGRLLLRDARATLAELSARPGAGPDELRFRAVIGGLVDEASARSASGRVRAYGEMVDLLWQDDAPAAALGLEELWNRLGRVRPLALLCAYAMHRFSSDAHAEPLRHICAAHARVLPAESYAELDDDEARRREVARLQQRARVLESEIAERERITAELRRVDRERARLLERESAARHEAEAANRLKDDFLALLSHELRTPLNAILGWAHTLRTGRLDDDARARGLETIARNAKLQAQLIDDVLDVSRIMAGKLRLARGNVDLGAVILGALDTVRPLADAKQLVVTAALDAGATLVAGDADRLQQVLWNLLTNAVKFTPPGGHIDVTLGRAGERARVYVRDDGHGIRADFLPHVFDRFRQADASASRTHGGLGLGLSIVRHLVELHGGEVSAASDGLGRGASFAVTLPLLAEPLPEAAPHRGDGDERLSLSLAGVRVLVVDDEDDARELLRLVLERHGAEVRVAGSTGSALGLVRAWLPAVLVSDIGMPGEDGYALVRRLRALAVEEGGGVPAVALTAYASGDDNRRALAAGFQTHVAKPVEPTRLVQVVAELARA